jgi:hypothetical protein
VPEEAVAMKEVLPFDELLGRVAVTHRRSHELLAWSQRLALTYRRLRRLRICGGSDAQARPSRAERTVDKMRRGGLPAAFDGRIWVGPGSGAACNGCGDAIGPTEHEFEKDYANALSFRFHHECYTAWSKLAGQPLDGDGSASPA